MVIYTPVKIVLPKALKILILRTDCKGAVMDNLDQMIELLEKLDETLAGRATIFHARVLLHIARAEALSQTLSQRDLLALTNRPLSSVNSALKGLSRSSEGPLVAYGGRRGHTATPCHLTPAGRALLGLAGGNAS